LIIKISLTINEKKKSDEIFNPKFKVEKSFMKPPKETYDKSDWNFRHFRKYDEFTKFFDKKTNIEY